MDEEDVRRRFAEIMNGASLADVRDLMAQIGRARVADYLDRARPELRHPRREEVVVYRVRAELVGEKPPIWRRLDLRSSMTLDAVHDVMQAAFGWSESHLHRFSVGGDGWDRGAQLFLCPFDVDEGEDDGVPEQEVRLDEVVAGAGDRLFYLYDYGDNRQVVLRVEDVRATDGVVPLAVCVDGRRAAPPEDSRGLEGAELLAIQGDPARFDPQEVNDELGDLRFGLREAGVPAPVISIIDRLRYVPGGESVEAAARALLAEAPTVSDAERNAVLRAWTWFIERAGGEGIELTSAGYLRPADVVEASAVVPVMGPWIGTHNRESQSGPLLHFRQSLVREGFLRKYRGRLLLTRIGRAGRADAGRVWDALVARYRGIIDGERVARGRSGALTADYSRDATVCVLLLVAGGGQFTARVLDRRGRESSDGLCLDDVAVWLTALGWRRGSSPVDEGDLYDEGVRQVLENLWDGPRARDDRGEMSAAARQFAREVLRRG
ncbi:plasmid pRiA4b ORF-3 family protein [Microbacterium aquimaris]|uniref:plasmid pRiA4b ORF-3 family protein n=1 Tax=Microbacterium aquimaris TaxID=459816 RepID=UPI002AD26FB7|nr:plasmid pRiA4b ORF-3 family protein [Microbacterium aquimaris]MDZ8274800.1 plasmid pRiA4b ORF-3 family protein [Microbacterium aquimaris]